MNYTHMYNRIYWNIHRKLHSYSQTTITIAFFIIFFFSLFANHLFISNLKKNKKIDRATTCGLFFFYLAWFVHSNSFYYYCLGNCCGLAFCQSRSEKKTENEWVSIKSFWFEWNREKNVETKKPRESILEKWHVMCPTTFVSSTATTKISKIIQL